MHDDASRMMVGNGPRHGGIGECRDVVDNVGARLQGRLRHGRFGGVNRDRDVGELPESLDDRDHPADFLLRRNWLIARTGGLAADVNHCGAFCNHALRMVQRLAAFKVTAAIGK